MFLLDTDMLSALRRRERHPAVVRWVASQRTSDLFLNVVTIGEIERGIDQQLRQNPRFAQDLSTWLAGILTWYGERILPVDLRTARRWGRLSARIGHDGPDLLIAATALEHGLTVATRNVRHFEPTGAPVLDPFHTEDSGA